MNDVASLLLWSLGRTTLWLAVAALITALVLRVAQTNWPAAHRLAWLVVLLVGWSFIRMPLAVPWNEAQPLEPTATVELAPAELLVDSEPPLEVIELAPPSDDIPATTPAAIARRPVAQLPVATIGIDWPLVLLGAWALGGAALVAAWAVGYVMFVRSLAARVPAGEVQQAEWHELLAAAGVRREIPLCMTEKFGPLLCRLPRGFEIIVPESLWRELTARERTAILRHELAHYQRGDVWSSLVARVLALPHWFNPAAWWAARQFDEAAELACDRAAAGDDATTDYASALVRLGQVGPRATFYGTAARGRSLAARIRRVLAGPSTEDPLMKKASLVAIAVGMAAASVVQIHLVAQQPAAEDKKPAEKAQPVEPMPPPTKQAPPPPEGDLKWPTSQSRAQKMVDKAREAYEANLAAYEAETVVMEGVYDWSLRWMRAAQIAAANDEQNAAAIQAHLDRMRELQKKITALYKIGTRGGEIKEMRAANFYVAEAERWLAEAETPATHRGVKAVPDNTATPGSMTFDINIKMADLRGELAQVYIDLQKTDRILGSMNKAKPGTFPAAELARLKADAQKLDVRLSTLTDQLLLYENKLRLVERSPTERKALSELSKLPPSNREPANRDAKTSVGAVRFKDKDFDSWVEVLNNELSAERRIEAMHAVATFGANGYGPQAARFLLEVGRGFPLWLKSQDQATQELTGAAVGAFKMIPAKDSLPLVLKSLGSEDAGERLFAVNVLPEVSSNRIETEKRLVAMLKDPDIDVRQAAVQFLVSHQPTPPELLTTLQEWLASDDTSQVPFATGAAFGFGATRGRQKFSQYSQLPNELLPSLLKAIERPDPYGSLVLQALGRYSDAAAAFSAAIDSANASPGPRAQQFLDELRKKK